MITTQIAFHHVVSIEVKRDKLYWNEEKTGEQFHTTKLVIRGEGDEEVVITLFNADDKTMIRVTGDVDVPNSRINPEFDKEWRAA